MSSAHARLERLLREQDGVVSRVQVLECGLDSAFIRRRLRRDMWRTVHPGTYITHTGPLTWLQRAWCAILDAEPAALSHQSALRVAAGRTDGLGGTEPIDIAIAAGRRFSAKPGIRLHRRTRLAEDMLAHLHPPRIRVEDAVLDVVAEAATELEAVAALADPVQARLTTPDRLLEALHRRSRIRNRTFISDLLTDVRDGTCSALEHVYLTRVERPHGLPQPVRQSPTAVGRRGFRDLEYPKFGLIIELDGRAFHDDAAARDRDMERDLDAAAFADGQSLRLGWGQSAVRPCTTARKVATLLIRRGWAGSPHRCGATNCAVADEQCPL